MGSNPAVPTKALGRSEFFSIPDSKPSFSDSSTGTRGEHEERRAERQRPAHDSVDLQSFGRNEHLRAPTSTRYRCGGAPALSHAPPLEFPARGPRRDKAGRIQALRLMLTSVGFERESKTAEYFAPAARRASFSAPLQSASMSNSTSILLKPFRTAGSTPRSPRTSISPETFDVILCS